MGIHFDGGTTYIYVSPNGNGTGLSESSPAYFKDVFAKLSQSHSLGTIVVKCLPGTYDFEDNYTYRIKGNVSIRAFDDENKPIFTRTALSADYLFGAYSNDILSFHNIVFDKWSAGRGDADTDIPACAKAYGRGEVMVLNCEIRATKFSGAINGVSCFTAINKGSQVTILANIYTSDPTILFNAPDSIAPGSTANRFSILYGYNGGIITGFTAATAKIEIKAGALGRALTVFKGLAKTEVSATTFHVTFDSCYRLIESSYHTKGINMFLTQRGYNTDGTVDNTAVGGTDFKVYDTLLALKYSARCRIVFTLYSDIFCENHFILAEKCSGYVILTSNNSNTRNINSTASGNSSSSNAAINVKNAACMFEINPSVVINNTSGLQFNDGIQVSNSMGNTVVLSSVSGSNVTIGGRGSAVRLNTKANVYLRTVTLTDAGNGLYLAPSGNECLIIDSSVTNNTTGINVTNGSRVTTQNVTLSGNTNNYNSGANVSAATAEVKTI